MTVNTIYNKLALFWPLNEENQQIFNFADFQDVQIIWENLDL
jgi:hypothetical protein